jgi:hypothetical protein
MLKKIVMVLLVLLAVPLLTALFVRKDYAVTTSVIIDRPAPEVFDYIKYFENQDNYSVWIRMDPDMKKVYRGVDGTEGFVAFWASENPDVGSGEQEIVRLVPGERIDYELRFFTPFESTGSGFMLTKAVNPGQTLVSWGFNGHMAYPANLMLLFMNMESMIAKDLQQGLDNLKIELERSP